MDEIKSNICKKGTMLLLTGPTNHLHIVMNDPVYCEECCFHAVLVVNVTSRKLSGTDRRFDDSCLLSPGSHSFIKHDSYISYKDAVVLKVSGLEEKIENEEAIPQESVNDDLYMEVLNGFQTSKRVSGKIKRFLRKHILAQKK